MDTVKRNKKETGGTGSVSKSALIIYALFFVYALSTGLLGTLMSTLLSQFGISVSDGGTLMFVSISAGQLLYPWLMGIVAEHAGLTMSMVIDIFCMIGSAVTALLV